MDIAPASVLVLVFPLIWSAIIVYCTLRMAFMKRRQRTDYFPFTSVVIAAWKEGKRLEKAIESVLCQAYKGAMEVIIVAGGDEATINVCKSFDSKIVFLEERERAGKWAALNRGVAAAKGDVVAFTDADCVVSRDWLTNLNSNLGESDGVVGYVTSTDRDFFSKSLNIMTPMFMLYTYFLKAPFFCGQNSAFRKTVFAKVQFKKSLVEDMVFTEDCMKNKMRIVFDAGAIVYHAFPKNVSGFINSRLRVITGTYESLLFNPMIFFYFVMGVANQIVGILFLIFYSSNGFVIPPSVFLITVPISAILVFLKKFGNLKQLANLKEMILISVLNELVNFVSILYFLSRRRVEWKIYQK